MRVIEILFHLLLQVPVAVVATLLAMRLLGERRSWVATTLAGAIGWTAGNILLVALNGGDWDAARLSVATVSVSIVFTMIAAVALDFFARPGTLARGGRSGLVVMPRPVKDLRRRFEPYARYRQIIATARRHGLAFPQKARRDAAGVERPPAPVALRRTLEELGVVFVKLGQMASTRDDLLPTAYTTELRRLQSHVEVVPRDVMEPHLEAELGAPVADVFAEFDWTPIGSASIAQAYAARLRTGEAVVVKVQRPEISELVDRDMTALLHLARTLEQRTPQGKDLRVTELADEFARNLRQELDFPREAANALDLATATDAASGVRIPHMHTELLTPRVLVQERFDGETVLNRARIAELGVDPQELADRLVKTMVEHMFSHGHFHADPHPGNVFLLGDGSLGLIDFGATGHLDLLQRTALLEMTVAAMRGDGAALRDSIEQVAIIGADVRDASLERALSRYIADNMAPGQEVGPGALANLIPLLATYDIHMPQELSVFFRALVLLDGTAKAIQPGYSLADGVRRLLGGQVAAPPGGTTMKEQLVDSFLQEMPRLRRLPAQVDRIATLTARGELRHRVALFSTEADARVVVTLVNRVVLGLAGGLLAVASAVLLLVATALEASGGADLTRVFGVLGLAVAAVLLLRAVAAIVRDGYN